MAQEITRTVSTLATMPTGDPETGRLQRRIVSWMPSDPTAPVGLVRALTELERARVRERLELVRASLEHRDPRSLDRAITGMLLSFPSARAGGDEAMAILAAYVHALSDLPPWAVNEAARRWTRGLVAGANMAFPPSSAELHEVAGVIVEAFQYEAALLERMLAGRVQNDPVPAMSRERRAEIALEVRKVIAKASLEAKAAALGQDGEQALRETENASSSSTFKPISDSPPTIPR